jgi:hypothetical protein
MVMLTVLYSAPTAPSAKPPVPERSPFATTLWFRAALPSCLDAVSSIEMIVRRIMMATAK